MSEQPLSTAAASRSRLMMAVTMVLPTVVAVGIIALALGPKGMAASASLAGAGWRPHAPNLELLAQAPLAVKVHLATVAPAFLIGMVQMLGPKGVTVHRVLGWTYIALMATTAISALFIPGPGDVRTSLLYLFSVFPLITLPLAIYWARRHNVARHSRAMTGLFFGGLVIAGLLTFIPGRLMWRMVFG